MHGLPSLHTVVVLVQLPVAGLHANCSHASFVGHVTLGVYTQVLLEHVSVVHRLLSLQMAAITTALRWRVPHPVAGEHVASRHLSAGSGHTRGVYKHALLEQLSIVHSLLSLHCSAMAVGVLSSKIHPVLALHPGVLQMSSEVQSAPISAASHDPAPVALHVYVVQNVSAGHGVFGSSAQYRRGVPDVTLMLHAACWLAGTPAQPPKLLIHDGNVQNVALFSHGNSVHAQLADKSDVMVHVSDPTVHCASLQLPGLHNPSVCACVSGVYTQPVVALHESVVHRSLSLHTVLVSSHTPVTALHTYCAHAVLVGHVTDDVYTHVLATQSSLVQLLLSLHSAAITLAALLRVPQPDPESQNDSRHLSAGVAHVTAVYKHVLFAHESVVHALLSLHCFAMSTVDLSITAQPVSSLHTGRLQISVSGHAAPRSVSSHVPSGLHV